MALSFKEVAEILKLIDASQCDEVVLELEGTRLVVRRHSAPGNPGAGSAPAAISAPAAQPAATAPAAIPTPAGAGPDVPETVSDPGLTEVRSPMVGTFYRRPSPDEPAFTETGQAVKKGDALCLIEVMKLYTTIEAPCDGIVERIAVEDAQTVEFNQLLFQIRA